MSNYVSCDEIQSIIRRCRELLSPNRETLVGELKCLKSDALDALCLAGHDETHIYRQIEHLDFYVIVYQNQGAALAAQAAHDSAYRLLDSHMDGVVIQKAPENIRGDLFRSVERIKELLTLAVRKSAVMPATSPVQAVVISSVQGPHDKQPIETPTLRRGRRRRRHERTSPRAHRTTASRRARTIAKVLGELDTLKPQMDTEQDYGRLAQMYKRFLSFRVAKNHPALREKLENLQAHRQHVRLAQEIAALHHGVTLSTAQTDWKRRKPPSFKMR